MPESMVCHSPTMVPAMDMATHATKAYSALLQSLIAIFAGCRGGQRSGGEGVSPLAWHAVAQNLGAQLSAPSQRKGWEASGCSKQGRAGDEGACKREDTGSAGRVHNCASSVQSAARRRPQGVFRQATASRSTRLLGRQRVCRGSEDELLRCSEALQGRFKPHQAVLGTQKLRERRERAG